LTDADAEAYDPASVGDVFLPSISDQTLLLRLLGAEAGSTATFPSPPSPAFPDLCRRHRVTGLIYPELARAGISGPPEIVNPIREAARKTLVDNLILLKALHQTASALRSEGIGFVLLKGASLLGFLYPEIQLRPMTDIDILIRAKDWPKVEDTLGPRGYRLPEPDEASYYEREWYHQVVETPDAPSCYLEFHWNLESAERSRIDPDQLIHDAVACEIEGERFLRLCDDHLLIHLSVHLAHHYRDPALLWLEDLRRLLRRGSFDWERIESTARIWRVENCLAYSLGYLERVFPGSLPKPARRFALSPVRRVILRALGTDDPALPHRPLAGKAAGHAVSMMLLDRWRDVARYVAVHSLRRIGRSVVAREIDRSGETTRVRVLTSGTADDRPRGRDQRGRAE
jgi:putative nucleotidyltransferase-like protein